MLRVISPWRAIVLDTSSFVAAIRSGRGAASEVVRAVLLGEFALLMDYKIGLEYRDVALRREHVAESRFLEEEIEMLIRRLEGIAEAVDVAVRTRPLFHDPDDDMILDVAINGEANAVVTNNVRHFKEAAQRFGIDVLTPKQLLGRMRKDGDGD